VVPECGAETIHSVRHVHRRQAVGDTRSMARGRTTDDPMGGPPERRRLRPTCDAGGGSAASPVR
jgi:hypothetical protein